MKPLTGIRAILFFLILAFIVAFFSSAFAAGSVTCGAKKFYDGKTMIVACSITADASDGSVPSTTFDAAGYMLCAMETNPGTTAPTDDYDVYVYSAGGGDLLGGAGTNRDAANTEIAYPTIDATTGQKGCVPASSALTLTVSGNSVHSAGIGLILFFARP